MAYVRHWWYTPSLGRYEFVAGPTGNRGENGFEYSGSTRKAEADLAFIFPRFKKEMMREFPSLAEQRFWRRDWSLGAVFDSQNWLENVRCNMHSADRFGLETTGHLLCVRNRDLEFDYRFFCGTKDAGKRGKVESVVKRVFGL